MTCGRGSYREEVRHELSSFVNYQLAAIFSFFILLANQLNTEGSNVEDEKVASSTMDEVGSLISYLLACSFVCLFHRFTNIE